MLHTYSTTDTKLPPSCSAQIIMRRSSGPTPTRSSAAWMAADTCLMYCPKVGVEVERGGGGKAALVCGCPGGGDAGEVRLLKASDGGGEEEAREWEDSGEATLAGLPLHLGACRGVVGSVTCCCCCCSCCRQRCLVGSHGQDARLLAGPEEAGR